MTNGNGTPEGSENRLSPGFKFKVIMTIVFFILALVYILWLIKLI